MAYFLSREPKIGLGAKDRLGPMAYFLDREPKIGLAPSIFSVGQGHPSGIKDVCSCFFFRVLIMNLSYKCLYKQIYVSSTLPPLLLK